MKKKTKFNLKLSYIDSYDWLHKKTFVFSCVNFSYKFTRVFSYGKNGIVVGEISKDEVMLIIIFIAMTNYWQYIQYQKIISNGDILLRIRTRNPFRVFLNTKVYCILQWIENWQNFIQWKLYVWFDTVAFVVKFI